MSNRNNSRRRNRSVNSVSILTGEGLQAQLNLEQLRQSGKVSICHGRTFGGQQVNSAAYHKTGQSIVLSPNDRFDTAISMPQNDFEIVARKFLEGMGCTITPPATSRA
jgi:hypothetical protein